jgi:hypothetical protein
MTEPDPGTEISDDAVSALAERRTFETTDPVLRAMRAWVAELDTHPIRPRPLPLAGLARGRVPHRRRLVRMVVGLTAVLTVSSTGLAAAATGNPWTPLRFATRQVYEFARHDSGRIPEWMVRHGYREPDRGAADRGSRSMQRPPLHDRRHPIDGPRVRLGGD